MTFLVAFGVFLAFGWCFPTLFKAFYWLFMLPIFTIGPASFIYLGCQLFSVDLSFTACCVIAFIFCALPFMKWTAPE